ncbi:Stk1 family PASTA domain-containing Ser/Thr kinase [Microlunatus speluncae]|uniref:Stk1 family PASTA domain-containing Ser/Thr kinase n=1 Tax=Microlunatus speluncae TaxID=2594267 RepID=UPI001C2CE7C6|nr:Stk1 family PASTA domain-containing Ser/Thr kinase [Microlunatus speluncae]
MTGDQGMVGGRYQLEGLLGRGGMAEVWRAMDTRLGRPVAVKQLRADLATDPTFQARFRREAQSAAGLNHPTIVAVYDTGEEPDQHTGVSVPYIVMELVEGQTLRDVLRDGRKILPERALELTQGVLDALSYSHKAGIIHRDIKPANVMLTRTGQIKVMDFGIARAVADTSATMTQTAAVIGTAQYLSPEQARGETVDARSDIYSAGCLLFELLVGRPPFVGESPVSVAYQHVREMPMAPSDLDPVITPDIDAITLKALAKSPDDRYQSAREMWRDMARVLSGQQATAMVPPIPADDNGATRVVPSVPVVPATQPEPDPLDDDFDDEDEEPKNRAGLIVFIVGLAVLLVAGVAFALYSFSNPGGNPGANQSPSFTPTPQVPKVKVPRVLGFTKEAAESMLTNENLKVDVKEVAGKSDGTLNTVTKQTPDDGEEIDEGSTVTIEINVGPKQVQIPDNLVGKDREDAQKALEKLKFDVEVEEATDEPDDAKAGEVLDVSPKEGSTHDLGTTVTLTVATGESEVPDLVGRTVESAEQAAEDRGFKIKVENRETTDAPPDTIVDQDPKAETMLPRGETITVYKAVTPEQSSPPPSSPDPSGSSSTPPSNSQSPGDIDADADSDSDSDG